VRVDNGEYAFFPGANNAPTLISTIPAATLPALPRSWEMYAHPELRRSPGYAVNFFGLAVDQTHLYCSLRAENKLLILDKTTAAPVKAVAVDEPGGMAMAPDGSLYLLSGQKLLKVSPDGTVLGTVIDRGLEAPYGLCVDAPGNLWISDQGAAMQVKIFSPAGRLLRTVGKAGGRALDGEWAKRRSTAFARPGQFYKPAEFTGIVKGLLFDCDWNGQMRVWDKDTGLYAGSLFQDGYRGPVPDENLVEVEYTNAHVFLWNGDCVALRMSSNPALKWPLEGTREQLKDCPDLFQGGFWWNATKQRTYWQGYHGTGGPELPEDQWAGTAVVVKLAPDGKGYTETIKLPWKTINPNFHPQTGDRIGFTWDLCVSTANAAEPARAFEIFVNAGSTWAFTSPSVWGQAIFQ
jgi:hypothetical protein